MFTIIFPNIDPIAINLHYISIRWYGIAYVIGIVFGAFFLTRLDQKYKIVNLNAQDLENVLSYIILGIIIGGRLGYVIFYTPALIFDQFLEIFKIWHGGMSFHGGLIGVITALWVFSSQKNKEFLSTTDLIVN